MPPIMSKPSKAAHMAIIYVTVGALVMICSAFWYAWMYFHQAPDGDPHRDAWMYVCGAIFCCALAVFIIGFALGRIGRAGRRAELPPEVSTIATAQPAVAAQPLVQSAAPGQAVALGQPVIPGQPAMPVQPGAPVASVAPTASLR
jgi:hypothetical protein